MSSSEDEKPQEKPRSRKNSQKDTKKAPAKKVVSDSDSDDEEEKDSDAKEEKDEDDEDDDEEEDEGNSGDTEIFVGNLAFSVTQQSFEKHFKKYGAFTNVTFPLRNDGKSKGIGFIQFETNAQAKKAVQAENGA